MGNVGKRRDRRRRLRLAFFSFSITSRERKSTRFRRRSSFFREFFGNEERTSDSTREKRENGKNKGKGQKRTPLKRRDVFDVSININDKTREKRRRQEGESRRAAEEETRRRKKRKRRSASRTRLRLARCERRVEEERRKTNGVRDVKRAPYFLRSRRGLRRKLRPLRRVPLLRDGLFALFLVLRAVRRRNRRG